MTEFDKWISQKYILPCTKCGGSRRYLIWQSDPAGGRGEYIDRGLCRACLGTGKGSVDQYKVIWEHDEELKKKKIEIEDLRNKAMSKLTDESFKILGINFR